jgi:SPP1 gp7 family putative phage head morphogenesis protein
MAKQDELIAIQAQHNVYIQKLAAQYSNDALPFIETMQAEIAARLELEVGRNLTPKRRERLLHDINDIVTVNLRDYTKSLSSSDIELGGYEAAFQAKTLNTMVVAETVAPSRADVNEVAKSTLIKLGDGSYTSYNQMLQRYYKGNAEQITNIVGQGFQSGVSTRDIIKDVMSEVDNRIVKTKKEAKRIAVTGTNHYANQARKTYFEDTDVVIGTRRIATIDSSTSGYCRGVDNTVVLKTDAAYSRAFAPFHPNCRTANIPEVSDLDEFGGERPSNFRDAETGLLDPKPIDTKKIYYDELSKLNKADMDFIIGPSLGKAFRKGLRDKTLTPASFAKLTISDIETRPLSIKEIKDRDNALSRILRAQD